MKRIFILMMLCVSVLSLFAETAYEKKVNEIKMEYFLFFKNGFYSAATMEDYYLISMLGGVDGALAMAQLDYGLKQMGKSWWWPGSRGWIRKVM